MVFTGLQITFYYIIIIVGFFSARLLIFMKF